MLIPLLYALLALSPAVLLLGAIEIHSRFKSAGRLQVPVTDKLLRSPGEGALKKMKELDHKTLELLIAVVAMPSVFLAFFLSFKLGPIHPLPNGLAGQLMVLVAMGLILATIIIFNATKRKKWSLGYRGERYVGQELNKLMMDGCRVFHDVPLTDNWNLDHVIVAPSGVYAVETKTRSKRRFADRRKEHEVTYDGKRLQFPDYCDTEKLHQTREQADRLALVLKDSLQENIYIHPVLTLPGWYVKATGSGDVTVLNPKQIRFKVVDSTVPALSAEKIFLIARFLDQRCRTVPFGQSLAA